MPIREIIRLDNPILRKKAHKVTTFDNRFQKLVDDMVATMQEAKGVGLAAPQIAISQRLIVIRLPDDEKAKEEFGDDAGVLYVFANPEITKISKEMVEGTEACLSIPGFFGNVERHEAVTIAGLDRNGKLQKVKAKGWLARVFQHEIDHLDGRLYIDIASEVWEAKPEDDEEDGEPSKPASGVAATEQPAKE